MNIYLKIIPLFIAQKFNITLLPVITAEHNTPESVMSFWIGIILYILVAYLLLINYSNKNMKHLNKKLIFLILVFGILLNCCFVNGQIDTQSHMGYCGSGSNFFLTGAIDPSGGGGGSLAPALPFPAYAIFPCGKFDIYYEDVHRHFHTGFDDTTSVLSGAGSTLGQVRRSTFDSLLVYIQSIFDFSNIPDSNHIRIYVDTSYSHTFHLFPHNVTNIYAQAGPYFDSTTSGIKNGWVNDFINGSGGIDPGPSNFHGHVQVNFDKTFDYGFFGIILDSPNVPWHNDYSIPFNNTNSCGEIDLFTALLHEMTHCMGWFSLIKFPDTAYTGLTPRRVITSKSIYTGIDWSLHVSSNNYPLSLTKVLTGTTGIPLFDTTNPLFQSNFNYWLNDSAAPKNQPVYSGAYRNPIISSFLSHLDDQPYIYTTRERISPGDQQEYVMGPFFVDGVIRRAYSKGELQSMVDILEYKLNSSYTTANPNIYSNHLPYSVKMAKDTITLSNYAYYTEEIKPDDTLTNSVGCSKTLSIASLIASGAITDADAGDIPNIYIDSTTLVNFRGCGNGDNNHVLLSMSSDSKSIIYRPRADFYGKAQFGFNITDGKEKGSFIVITYEVFKGSNVTCPVGSNMVCNPGFENGSEVKRQGSLADESIPNASSTEDQLHEGKWQGINFSDSHPYDFNSNVSNLNLLYQSGIMIGFDYYFCGSYLPTSTSEVGNLNLYYPIGAAGTPYYYNPFPESAGGKRYQNFSPDPTSTGGSYYYLKDSLRHCSHYTLEFDIISVYGTPTDSLPLNAGFADHTVALRNTDPVSSFNYFFNKTIPFNYTGWTHISIPFWYCGTNPSNLLYLSKNGGSLFYIDNLSLKLDTIPPPLLVNITKSLTIPGCNYLLTANVTNGACNISYDWTGTGISGLTNDTVEVSATTTSTYTVSVNDGCRDSIAKTTITYTPLGPISGASQVCIGSVIFLSDSASGGTWTGSTAVATINSYGGVYGITAGTVVFTYTDLCGAYTTKTITVNPLPAISGPTHVCIGSGTSLTSISGAGIWSSSNTAIATVGASTGLVTGISAGTVTISFTLTSTGCINSTTITVNPLPAPITGTAILCTGAITLLTDTPTTGTWSSVPAAVATVSGGVVNGVNAGTATIHFTLSTGCFSSIVITVNPLPSVINDSFTICVGMPVTLTDSTTDGTWTSLHTDTATIGWYTGIVNGIIPGRDTIIYTAPTGCARSLAIKVYGGQCSPCNIFGNLFKPLGLSGVITYADSVDGGNFFIGNDVTIEGNMTFNSSRILIDSGVTITVDTASSLDINFSHLFGSCKMWNGISLASSGSHSGRIHVKNYSLIEDAMTAITAIRPAAADTGNIVLSENVIFNRNRTGIDIEDFATLNAVAPFVIHNTVFTSRDLSGTMPPAIAYPLYWPAAMDLKMPWAPPGAPFAAPFTINNPTGAQSGGGFPLITCKNGYPAYAGIKLDSVGTDTSNAPVYGGIPIPAYYSEIVIGDTADIDSISNINQNLFDNMAYGIYATDANVSSVNNAFMTMLPYETYPPMSFGGGDGIYASVTNDVKYHKRLRVYSPNPTYNNLFYGFRDGVECYGYFEVYGQHAWMINANRNNHFVTNGTGLAGYLVETAKFDTINISNNNINNVNEGIALLEVHDPATTAGLLSQLMGYVVIDNDTVQANPLGYGAITTQYVELGITVQNLISSYSLPGYSAGTINNVHVDNNLILDAYSGIYLNNLQTQQPSTSFNTIHVRPGLHSLQYGINHTHCRSSTINYNFIEGSVPAASSKDSMRAVYSASNSLISIGCNTEQNIGRGFEYFIGNPMTWWHDNTMTNNDKGMVLNGAVIGNQGAWGKPINNVWTPGTWTPSIPQTFTQNGASPIHDTLFVANSTATLPSFNWSSPYIPGLFYAFSDGIDTTTLSPGAEPAPCPALHPHTINGVFVNIAQQGIPYTCNIIPNNWMGQYKLWETLQLDSGLLDSSVVLAKFDTMAANTRYALLTGIETYLAAEDYTDALTLLNSGRDTIPDTSNDYITNVRLADDASATYIVENYMSYFRLYLNYMRASLSSTDSLQLMALAQLCPQRNGTVVYQARALYSFIYNDFSMFNDDSCINIDSTYVAERQNGSNFIVNNKLNNLDKIGGYVVYPNPSGGHFLIQQKMTDNQPVKIDVYDVFSQKMYSDVVRFNNQVYLLDLTGRPPGTYFLRIQDFDNKLYSFILTLQ